MKDATKRYLDKSRKLLDNARTALSVKLFNNAGRDAYLSGFHAAQAFLYEATDKSFKSHNGVRTVFLESVKNSPHFTQDQKHFLFRIYNLKQIADYETGDDSDVPPQKAIDAVEEAAMFVENIHGLLKTP